MELIPLKTNIKMTLVDSYTNEILEVSEVHNIVTNVGKSVVAQLIGGLTSSSFAYIAIGTDTTAETGTDVALGVEVTRALASISESPTGTVKFEKTFAFSSGESYAITEIGLFDSATASGSNMLNRATDSAKNVSSGVNLITEINIQVS